MDAFSGTGRTFDELGHHGAKPLGAAEVRQPSMALQLWKHELVGVLAAHVRRQLQK